MSTCPQFWSSLEIEGGERTGKGETGYHRERDGETETRRERYRDGVRGRGRGRDREMEGDRGYTCPVLPYFVGSPNESCIPGIP